MLRKLKYAVRRDYFTVLGAVAILLGTLVIVGIAYTYMNRPPALIDAVSHVLKIRKLPADL